MNSTIELQDGKIETDGLGISRGYTNIVTATLPKNRMATH